MHEELMKLFSPAEQAVLAAVRTDLLAHPEEKEDERAAGV